MSFDEIWRQSDIHISHDISIYGWVWLKRTTKMHTCYLIFETGGHEIPS